ncbi:hypothetical protein XELAEV_18031446mg [Xenopus laevis]|uniref:Uncharacterized protein n=1 Tax=Xenopus laevis TaxID=8355 RepID=A0A974CMS4_XENLA|nr:hypothetical protein XELAEV_18031446mg [Xenopus laevis]
MSAGSTRGAESRGGQRIHTSLAKPVPIHSGFPQVHPWQLLFCTNPVTAPNPMHFVFAQHCIGARSSLGSLIPPELVGSGAK